MLSVLAVRIFPTLHPVHATGQVFQSVNEKTEHFSLPGHLGALRIRTILLPTWRCSIPSLSRLRFFFNPSHVSCRDRFLRFIRRGDVLHSHSTLWQEDHHVLPLLTFANLPGLMTTYFLLWEE